MGKICHEDCFHCPYPDCILKALPPTAAKEESAAVDKAAFSKQALRRQAKLSRKRAYYLANRERINAYGRRYYAAHKAHVSERKHLWYKKTHPHAVRYGKPPAKPARPVIATTPNGKEARYPSITQAAAAVHASPGSICMACRGKVKTAKGRRWRYADETSKGSG